MLDPTEKCRKAGAQGPCPACGFVNHPVPDWAQKPGTEFAIDRKRYRTVSGVGSTNGGTHLNMHFWDYVIVQPLADETWELPDAPCLTKEIDSSLQRLFKMPKFSGKDLERAIRSVK